MEHYYNNYRKQQKERERIMQSGCLIFAVFMAMMLTAWLVWQRGMLVEARTEAATESLAGQVLRLHVLADSDSLRDQQIKMQVKEEVVAWLHENRPEDADRKEMEVFIGEHLTEIKKLAQETVRRAGSSDTVTAELTRDKSRRKPTEHLHFRKVNTKHCAYGLVAGKVTTGGVACIRGSALRMRCMWKRIRRTCRNSGHWLMRMPMRW